MSLILCDMCKNLKDSDAEPEGFYVEDHEDEYICEICVEDNNLEYDV